MTTPDCLLTASRLRVPVFQPATTPRERMDALEEFMLLSAYWSGECHGARLELLGELHRLEREWAAITGWEPFRQGKTDASVDQAKATLRPDLWNELVDKRWLVKRLSDEIDRLDRDATKVSRAYTMLQGA